VDEDTGERRYWESTTAVAISWLPRGIRRRLTPAAVGSAIGALVIAVGYVLNARHEIHDAQAAVQRLHVDVTNLERERDVLHRIETQLAVVNSKVDGIGIEVDRQREWRERIEDAAELPPHARRRK
jgi:hypothetical protein